MNIPFLKTFQVESAITDFLNRKFEQYKITFENIDRDNAFEGEGYQTGNLLEWEDEEYDNFRRKELLNLTSHFFEMDEFYDNGNIRIQFFYNHMLEYGKGTSMLKHTHKHNEDFVMFIYFKKINS